METNADCWGSEESDIARYFAKAAQSRTPLSASFELTRRCNFRCVHCYLGDQESIHQHRGRELDTKAVFRLLEEMTAAGTLFLTLTGGDPMIRPDFQAVYRRAVELGLLVTVFCNGTLITDEIACTFAQYPPRIVEITLYGATQSTFEAVTQRPGSFAACMAGIERLRLAKVRLRLKTMVMSLNAHEFQAIRRLAVDMDLQFRHDCSIHAAVPNDDNGGRSNTGGSLLDTLHFRLAPEQAAAADMSVEPLAAKLRELAQSAEERKPSGKLHRCGAGSSSYHVSPYGQMQPCLIVPTCSADICAEGIQAGWSGPLQEFADHPASASFLCGRCENKKTCTACPAVLALNTGSPEQVDAFYCQYAEQRRQQNARCDLRIER
ncbi:radical SAM protein [Candidatus Electronema sp. TJ]|uniref:radical SAM protein n=1 Tax=Candidatus Electronema sp. TJ TaxID=3401573 RepID=UPI003AA7FDBF